MIVKRLAISASFMAALLTVLICCKKPAGDEPEEGDSSVISTVTAMHPMIGDIRSTVQVNAVSDFLIKSSARSTINGYLTSVVVRPGDAVQRGQVLFKLETREAHNLGNTLSGIDTTLNFQGSVSIRSPCDGYVESVNYQVGEYTQEGNVLASITDAGSLVFLLDIPFELTPIIKRNQQVTLNLPDGRDIQGKLMNSLPAVDSASQTQRFIVRIPYPANLPANLIATITLVIEAHPQAVILPRDAVLSDDVQNHFWVMKVIDSTLAVRIDVRKGIETAESIEIVSPRLSTTDLIIATGNYGLPDSARIVLQH